MRRETAGNRRCHTSSSSFPFWILLTLLLTLPGALLAAGDTPSDPLTFDLRSGSMQLSLREDRPIWLRVPFEAATSVSHVALETTGSLDTVLSVYANLGDALADAPLAVNDDGGSGSNARLQAPLGFASPYLVRVSSYFGDAGSTRIHGDLTRVASDRCDWPAGCSLAAAAQGNPTGSEVLDVLRQVRTDVLMRSPRGREIADLYWRLGVDLIPDFALDGDFRQQVFDRVADLLPMAGETLRAEQGIGGRTALSRRDVEGLRQLLELLLPHLSISNAQDLSDLWQAFDLEARIDLPLADILIAEGLLAGERAPRTLIAKLRTEPAFENAAGGIALKSGDASLDQLLDAAGATAARRVHSDSAAHRAAGLSRTIAFDVPDFETAETLLESLRAHPGIVWVDMSTPFHALARGADPFRADLWGLDAIRAPQAWSTSRGACSAPVAVIDTGIRSDLVDFGNRVLEDLGWDFAYGDNDPDDQHGHGTHVSGTIAAQLGNAASIAGVAPQTCIIAIKVLDDGGSGTEEDVAAGIRYATDVGARVINMSLGCDCDVQPAIEEALEYAADHDVVVAAAAGNDGVDYLGYPASSEFTIAVGAVDEDLELADFSNYGHGLDIVAPGVDVVSLFPDGESCTGSGTSMATPHVAGVAAAIRAADPTLAREGVRDLLLDHARDLGPRGPDLRFGHGLVDAAAALEASRTCTEGTCLELQDGRFQVRVTWRDFENQNGVGSIVPHGSNDSGLIWFFRESNWEMLVKVLDGCGINGNFWVLAAATTNVEYTLEITDRTTGTTATYFNPLGTAATAIIDTTSFPTCSASNATTVPLAPADDRPGFEDSGLEGSEFEDDHSLESSNSSVGANQGHLRRQSGSALPERQEVPRPGGLARLRKPSRQRPRRPDRLGRFGHVVVLQPFKLGNAGQGSRRLRHQRPLLGAGGGDHQCRIHPPDQRPGRRDAPAVRQPARHRIASGDRHPGVLLLGLNPSVRPLPDSSRHETSSRDSQ